MDHPTFDHFATAVALDRYAVIAPMATRTLDLLEYSEELKRTANAVHHFRSSSRDVKFSTRTVQRWYRWYVQGREIGARQVIGIDALKPARRCDCGAARQLPAKILEQAERLRREEPSRSTSTLISLIEADYETRGETAPPIVEATLARHLRKKHASRRALKREGRAFPRYERPHRNAVWQGDWTQGFVIPDPTDPGKMRMTHLHAFIDDHTRFIVHAEFYFNQNLPCLEDCFRKAIIVGGIPESTYWDNGRVYQSHQLLLVAARLGTQVIFATPYAPEGKGKIERWFHTVQSSFYPEAKRANITTLEELNQFFWGWLEKHYQTREHASLGTTPRARWEADAHRMRPVDPASLVDLFLWEETRRVNKTGCFPLKGNEYAVEEHLVGKKVQVRYDPFDLSRVRVYLDGRFLQTTEPFKLESHTGRVAESKKPAAPGPLASAERYRKRLSAGYQREVEATLTRAQRGGRSPDCLTRAELAAELAEALEGRQFSVKEGSLIADFFARNAPLRTVTTHAALSRAVEEKGTQRHLRFYLDAVGEARLEGGDR
jgi:transposase InsO family protein